MLKAGNASNGDEAKVLFACTAPVIMLCYQKTSHMQTSVFTAEAAELGSVLLWGRDRHPVGLVGSPADAAQSYAAVVAKGEYLVPHYDTNCVAAPKTATGDPTTWVWQCSGAPFQVMSASGKAREYKLAKGEEAKVLFECDGSNEAVQYRNDRWSKKAGNLITVLACSA